MSEINAVEYLASKGYRGKSSSGGHEMAYPCFFSCDEPVDSRKRKLYLNVETGMYCCFVCEAAGGTTLLQRHFGDEVTRTETPARRSAVLEAVTRAGERMLAASDEAMLYLVAGKRWLPAQAILDRRLGYVGNRSLIGSLPIGEFTTADIQSAGVVWKDGPYVGRDFFRDSVLIPYIQDGRVVQVRGKSLRDGGYYTGPGERSYLYNADALKDADEVICVEGEFDCFSGDTEIFSPQGWVRLEDYHNEPVLQYAEDGTLRFVQPIAYTSKDVDRLLRVTTHRNGGIDLLVTPGHRMVATLPDGSGLKIHRADEHPSDRYHVPRVGQFDGPGIPLSNDEIALLLAISADASIDTRKVDGAQYVRFGFKKERKANRLRGLLKTLDVEFSDSITSYGWAICFRVPNYLTAFRTLPMSWLAQASLAQREFMLDELIHWDGNRVVRRTQTEYSSRLPANVEWVQALAHTTGRVSTLMPRSNQHGNWWKASILHEKQSTSWQSIQTEDVPGQRVYCVQVPSGMLMVRRRGMVSISGNCIMVADLLSRSPDLKVRSIAVVGIPGVHSLPDDFDARIENVKRVYIGTDPDEAGRKAADRLAERFGNRAHKLEWPEKLLREAQADGYKLKDIDWTLWIGRYGATWADVLVMLRQSSRLASMAEAGSRFRNRPHTGIKLGLVELDAWIHPGLLPGQVMVPLAKSGAGKTIWCCNVAYNLRQRRVLYISLEQTQEEIYMRLARIHRFYRPYASNEEIELTLADLRMCDQNRLGSDDFAQLVEEYTDSVGAPPELVVIDYLGYYARGVKGGSPYEKTSSAIMQLKEEAKRHRLSIIAPHQVNRVAEKGKPLDASDARDSGVVEETADFMLGIFRPSDALTTQNTMPDGKLRQALLKSRHGNADNTCSLQMGLLSLVIVDSVNPLARQAAEEAYLKHRGYTYDAYLAERAAPTQLTMRSTA